MFHFQPLLSGSGTLRTEYALARASGVGSSAVDPIGIGTNPRDVVGGGVGAAVASSAIIKSAPDSYARGIGAATAVGRSTFTSVGAAIGEGSSRARPETNDSVYVTWVRVRYLMAEANYETGDGAAAGTGAASSTGVGLFSGQASAAGTGASSVEGASTHAAQAQSSGTGNQDSTATGITAFQAQAAGTGETSAVGESTGAADASSSGAGASSVQGAATFSAQGQTSGTGDSSVIGRSVFSGQAQAQGTTTADAVGSSTVEAVGSASGLGAADAVGRSTFSGVASSQGVGAAAGGGRWFITMFPDLDVSDGGWTTHLGGNDLYTAVDEASVDDADFIRSSDDPASDACELTMSDPGVNVGEEVLVEYRYAKVGPSQINLTVRLKQGAATIATWNHNDVGDTIVEASQSLTAPQLASITDYDDLRLEFSADTV